jgi:ferredoxin
MTESASHATAGRLTGDQLTTLGIPAAASAYICGPPSFMTDMRDALTALGISAANIHTEQFAALPTITPGLTRRPPVNPYQPPGPGGSGPQVTFARSGITTAFGRRWRNVLDLADACAVPTRWSCRAGVCHTCSTPLLSGGYRYDPEPLEPPTDGQVLICCARPKTDLVLDM